MQCLDSVVLNVLTSKGAFYKINIVSIRMKTLCVMFNKRAALFYLRYDKAHAALLLNCFKDISNRFHNSDAFVKRMEEKNENYTTSPEQDFI